MEILPEHIRANLARYRVHRQCACMQCGYVGLMGVHREENKYSSAQFFKITSGAIAVFAVILVISALSGSAGFPWWLGLSVGAVIAFSLGGKNTYLACPNCNTTQRHYLRRGKIVTPTK
jgi:hypothetical protein